MRFRTYVVIMAVGTLFAWGGWTFVLFSIDQVESGTLGLFVFYLTLLTALIGTLAIIGVVYRVHYLKRYHLISREVKISFRHAFMLSLVAVISLALAAHGLLFWWNLLALFACMGLVEYGFILIQESRRF